MNGRVLRDEEIRQIEHEEEIQSYYGKEIPRIVNLIATIRDRDMRIAELRIAQQPLYSRRLLEKQNAILLRELEWFADPDNYVGDHDEDGYHSAPIANGFKRAQRTLEGME